MPASLPGATLAQNQANPNQGRVVCYDPLSGPKGAPLDRDQAGNCSTGAMSTGIGFGPGNQISPISDPLFSNEVAGIRRAGFNDDQIPGTREPNYGTQNTFLSRFMYIGGGRMITNPVVAERFTQPYVPSEYTAGVAICGAGNGGSRDGGAGPAFTGFAMKMVTAAADVAPAGVIETGYVNRTGATLPTSRSAHGSASAQLAAAS